MKRIAGASPDLIAFQCMPGLFRLKKVEFLVVEGDAPLLSHGQQAFELIGRKPIKMLGQHDLFSETKVPLEGPPFEHTRKPVDIILPHLVIWDR